MLEGVILKGIGGFYYIDTERGVYECRARGIFRKEGIRPTVGDAVRISVLDEEKKKGSLDEILPRRNELIRPRVSNVDQAVIVFAAKSPNMNLDLLDRFLLLAEEQELDIVIVINKIDKPEARVSEVEDEVLELFMELEANDDQLDFPVIYANGRDGIAKYSMDDDSSDLEPLFKTIIKYCPCPKGDIDGPLQFMVTTLDYDDYVGKIAIGRIVRGRLRPNQNVVITDGEGQRRAKVGRVYTYEGLKRTETEEAAMGEIACIIGIPDLKIGETVADPQNPEALPKINIDEPTLSMIFYVNDSPFAGQEGEFVTSRHLRDRLFREVQTNVSLRVEETDSADAFKVSGRGELHIAVLIEEMRREGYEMQIGKPSVITKEINGQKCEPLEALTIDVPQEFMGSVMEKLGTRKAEMVNMVDIAGYTRLEFIIPARGLIGFRSEFLTATKGNGIMYHVFHGYAPWKGEIPGRTRGSLVAFESGTTTGYGIFNLQDRGDMFISPAQEIYLGQVVGESNRDVDIDVNPCKKKHLTNTRASASDEALRLVPPRVMGLEKSLEWINDDELVEVTPKSIRIRKAILDKHDRKKAMRKAQQ